MKMSLMFSPWSFTFVKTWPAKVKRPAIPWVDSFLINNLQVRAVLTHIFEKLISQCLNKNLFFEEVRGLQSYKCSCRPTTALFWNVLRRKFLLAWVFFLTWSKWWTNIHVLLSHLSNISTVSLNWFSWESQKEVPSTIQIKSITRNTFYPLEDCSSLVISSIVCQNLPIQVLHDLLHESNS